MVELVLVLNTDIMNIIFNARR